MKLPLWRAVLGFGVLALLLTVLLSLAPIYLRDYRLRQYLRTLLPQPDDALKTLITKRAHDLELPVQTSDITVSHPAGKQRVEAKYTVDVNLALYQVDLHFHPSAER